jgi:hypothetical protein
MRHAMLRVKLSHQIDSIRYNFCSTCQAQHVITPSAGINFGALRLDRLSVDRTEVTQHIRPNL